MKVKHRYRTREDKFLAKLKNIEKRPSGPYRRAKEGIETRIVSMDYRAILIALYPG